MAFHPYRVSVFSEVFSGGKTGLADYDLSEKAVPATRSDLPYLFAGGRFRQLSFARVVTIIYITLVF
jgi:hypothetical protein